MPVQALLSIGELSRRTVMSGSAIRFYEAKGLVTAIRTAGNQRRFESWHHNADRLEPVAA